MAVTRQDVIQVARLARLQLNAVEIESLTHELNAILGHVEDLATVPFDGDEPDEGDAVDGAPLRSDDGEPDLLETPPASFAPAWEEGFFTLPRLDALGGEDSP